MDDAEPDLTNQLANELWQIRGAEKELSEAVGHFLRSCALLESNMRKLLAWYFDPEDEDLFVSGLLGRRSMGSSLEVLAEASKSDRGRELWGDLSEDLMAIKLIIQNRNRVAHSYLGLAQGTWNEDSWSAIGDSGPMPAAELDDLWVRTSQLANKFGELLNSRAPKPPQPNHG